MTHDYPAKPRRERAPGSRERDRSGHAEREPTRRLFVACDLPPAVGAKVSAWQDVGLRPRDELRVVHTLHVTLCFLGNVAERRVDDVAAALRSLTVPALPTALGEALFLPERGAKRVVALRLDDPTGTLAEMQSSVSAALYDLGVYRPEKRPWLPHLTVARYRRPGQPFSLQNVTIESFGLPSVILYASVLERGGAVHTPLASFPTVS